MYNNNKQKNEILHNNLKVSGEIKWVVDSVSRFSDSCVVWLWPIVVHFYASSCGVRFPFPILPIESLLYARHFADAEFSHSCIRSVSETGLLALSSSSILLIGRP